MFERFSDEGLAQTAYLIACERTREAVVVDPRRDIDAFVSQAQRHGLTIAHAIETHIHADFVSGARELSARGARVVAGPGASLHFPFHEARDREVLDVGDLRLEILHTPGHTPEHISILVREPNRPTRILTGDTLFVGAVGRPDLLGAEQSRELAGQLYDSLFDTLLALGDEVEVHPGHGAGSLCGVGIGNDPHTTIGRERRFSPLLQQISKPAFVKAVLEDLPETPAYFARMKLVNQGGPPVLHLGDGVPAPKPIAANDARALVDAGALILDLRSREAFGAGHSSGAINLGFGPRIGYWGGWLLPRDTPLLLVGGEPTQNAEAYRQLLRVGLDAVAGFVGGGYEGWRASGGPTAQIEQITARALRERLTRQSLTVVDVRTPKEFNRGHVDHAINLPLGDLPHRSGELRGLSTVATICESGYRSALASSLLLRAGIDVVNVTDGTSAFQALAGA